MRQFENLRIIYIFLRGLLIIILWICFVFREQGALVALMDKDSLRKRFPWLNVEDIELGSYGKTYQHG